ncbi:MAG: two-component regulator propeller domain-containing protein [Agriterribacter sp.]
MANSVRHICFFFFLLTAFAVRAQEYVFTRVSMQEGLLSNNILSIYQDPQGYMWIGTANGLQRYDGYTFRNSLSDNTRRQVDQILEDSKGNMWIRMGKVVGTFDRINFTFSGIELADSIAAAHFVLGRDASHNIYLLQPGGKCFYFNTQQKRFTANTPFSIPDSLGIYGIVDDAATNCFWINTTVGLAVYNKTKRTFHSCFYNGEAHPLLRNKVFSSGIAHFSIDKQRRYWIQQWNTRKNDFDFYCYDERSASFTKDSAGLSTAGNGNYFDVYGFTSFKDNSVVVYGNNCLRVLRNGVFTEVRDSISNTYAIRFNIVNAVLQDREETLWMATDDGLYSTVSNLHNTDHIIVSQQNGKASVNCLLQDEMERTWIGTWGRGVIVLKKERGVDPGVNIYGSLPEDKDLRLVWDMERHTKTGKIWIGCQTGKLVVYDPAKNSAIWMQPKIFQERTVRQLEEDRNGALWFGLQSGKLFRLDHAGNFEEMYSFKGLISKLYEDNKGTLWVAVKGEGLFEMDIQTGKITRTWKTSAYVKDVLQVNDSVYMFAAEELQLLNTVSGKTDSIRQYENIPVGEVYSMQQDDKGMIWVSTTNGIFRFNHSTGNLIRYTQRDGLISVYNNSFILETSLRLKNGNLVFGGNEHLVVFNPADYQVEAVPPDVSISAWQLFDTYLSPQTMNSEHSFRYNQNSFTVEFAALSFRQIEKLIYEYKLEGADNDWTAVKIPRPVHYTLSPGKYRFLVRAKNSLGVYSNNITVVPFAITPPFWKTYWFLAIILAAIGALLYYLHRLRVRRLLQLEKVRSKLARDLHDDMGSTLSTINILSNMAMHQKTLDEFTSKQYLQKINHSATQMMQSMDDIVWSINPANDSAVKMLARMKETAGAILEPQQIEYSFEVNDKVKALSFSTEYRQEIFLVFKEAINNIVKYAQCTEVKIHMTKQEQFLVLGIIDNGKGFEAGANAGSTIRGNGLKNMEKRAAQLKGSVSITSIKDKGTSVTLRVPVA